MPHLKVFIKWGRQSLSDLFIDPEQPPLVLKTELCKLTGVQPERQRLLLQGTALKGANLILIGSPGDLPSEPVKKTTFIEDLTSVQMGLSVDVPTGLMNMGNSCFLNATLQCLRTASPLHDALCRFKVSSINDPAQRFAAALADLYLSMDRITMQSQADGEDDRVTQESHDIQALHEIMTCGGQRSLFDQVVDRTAMDLQWQKPVQVAVPVAVLKALQQSESAFAEIGSDGLYVQQDALHCWCKILQLLREVLEGHRSWRELEAWQNK
uniref:Ubiquitin carboxyl-terminal hydrolase 14 n=1 Tax=Eptatretus burgeri TaxID=7764 RepID=A0A8C4N821_EPTBU